MLFLPRQPLDTLEDLRVALGNAIAIELSTIPPYLTALFSLQPGANAAAAAIVRSVAIEEMLHLSLACNMLNAVGGRPDIPGALVQYPSPLPLGIGAEPGGPPFIVPLARLSQDSIKTFLTIEEPEHELEFPERRASLAAAEPEYHTIGEFYAAVKQLFVDLGPDIFERTDERQVSGWIGIHELHPVRSTDDACKAIDLIVDQGEGTTTSPAADPEELAHYYRFLQIQRDETLSADESVQQGYSWGSPAVPLIDDYIWPMIENPPLVALPQGSPVARQSDQFDATFTTMIDDLQRTFDGEPRVLGSAVAQMHALRLEAQQLVRMRVPGKDGTAGPRFLYVG